MEIEVKTCKDCKRTKKFNNEEKFLTFKTNLQKLHTKYEYQEFFKEILY